METEAETRNPVAPKEHSAISEAIRRSIETGSWIRQMFEEGARLKKEFGDDNVFDFTLGNPSVPPPTMFREALVRTARESQAPDHRYMTNVGLEPTRQFIADLLRPVHGDGISADDVVMTCGAAGGLNLILKSILDRDDEIMLIKPYFPEYLFYVDNHGGRPVLVDPDEDFQPDLERIRNALTPRTRAVIVNTPNNPSGVVYTPERVEALGRLLEEHSAAVGRPVYMVLDEVYRRLRYTDVPHPSAIKSYTYGLVTTSFSKDLGLAGERIGFVLVNPEMPERDDLLSALSISNRILGFVNAPALMQRVLPLVGHETVDVEAYRRNRDLLVEGLTSAGYEMPSPDGAFFVFPRVPGDDDMEFCRLLREHRVLCVPGCGFGTPGHIRISYAVPRRVIETALPVFADVRARLTP